MGVEMEYRRFGKTGVRMPVESMSRRAFMGIVQALRVTITGSPHCTASLIEPGPG